MSITLLCCLIICSFIMFCWFFYILQSCRPTVSDILKHMQTWWTIVTTHAILDQEQKFAVLWLANIHYWDPSRYNWLCAMCTPSMFMLSEKSGEFRLFQRDVTIAKQFETVLKQRLTFRWNSNDTLIMLIAGSPDGAAGVAAKHICISLILKAQVCLMCRMAHSAYSASAIGQIV